MKVTLNGEFEYWPVRCPVTGIQVWPVANCRCHHCRPDLHWLTSSIGGHRVYWTAVPSTTGAVQPPPTTYTIGAGR